LATLLTNLSPMKEIELIIDRSEPLTVEVGQTIREVLRKYKADELFLDYVAIKNGIFTSLSESINENACIVTFKDFFESSRRAYENAAILILQSAIEKVLPGRTLYILNSMCDGVYCELDDNKPLESEVLEAMIRGFDTIVADDLPITPVLCTRIEAQAYFSKNGYAITGNLIKHSALNYIVLYTLRDKRYWLPSPPAPSTGLIQVYQIRDYKNGFILRSPVEGAPHTIQPFYDQERLYEIFNEAEHWGNILDLKCVSQLNDLVTGGNISEMIKISEALHEKKIAAIADKIDTSPGDKRLIFAAGPSSSGKTTFMKRLYIQLRVLGYRVISLSLDDYYKDRDEILREQGDNVNFETLDALDLKLLNTQLKDLIAGKQVTPPIYDFHQGKKVTGRSPIKADPNTLFIIEGIHGINPHLTQDIDDRYKFKIYISALTHLNFDNINRFPTHDARLIRRIVRDQKFRGYSAAQTINIWKSVIEGEKRYIFKYQGKADVMFNSSLPYEFGILKQSAELALKTVQEDDPSHPESERLLNILSYFLPIDDNEVPPTSIIREFIGDSSFKYH